MAEPRSSQDVEFFYVAGMATAGTRPHVARKEWKAWLAAHDRTVKAEALREAAGRYELVYENHTVAQWLRARADQIEGNTE